MSASMFLTGFTRSLTALPPTRLFGGTARTIIEDRVTRRDGPAEGDRHTTQTKGQGSGELARSLSGCCVRIACAEC